MPRLPLKRASDLLDQRHIALEAEYRAQGMRESAIATQLINPDKYQDLFTTKEKASELKFPAGPEHRYRTVGGSEINAEKDLSLRA